MCNSRQLIDLLLLFQLQLAMVFAQLAVQLVVRKVAKISCIFAQLISRLIVRKECLLVSLLKPIVKLHVGPAEKLVLMHVIFGD